MRPVLVLAALLAASINLGQAGAVEFYPIGSVTATTSATDLFPVSNLIQGPGVGIDAAEPHDKILGGAEGNWVTAAPGGFPADYIAVAGMPVITLDLGQERVLHEISTWGYASTNANGVSQFSLEFLDASSSSVGVAGPFFPTNNDTNRQTFHFDPVLAQTVNFVAEDNFFIPPGDNSVDPPGGDRVGLGEIAFEAIPEPSSLLLVVCGVLACGLRRR